MKKNIFKMAVVGLSIMVVGAGCGRLRDLLNPQIQQHNSDSNEFKSTLDQVDDNINTALKDIPGFGKMDGSDVIYSSPLCGVTIDSSELADQILYFNFDGVTPCFSPSVTRSGQIKVELIAGNNWGEQGAVLRETFIDFRVTRLSDNKFIEFDGVKTLENINGHNWWLFLTGAESFAYRERALDMQVSFSNNQQAVWNSARTTEWSYTPSQTKITFTASGDTSFNGFSNVDSWGVNRYAQDFVTYYNSAIVSDTYCGLWRFNSGELVHEVDGNLYTLTLGVNQQGNASTQDCAYGFKVSWEVNGEQNSQVFSY